MDTSKEYALMCEKAKEIQEAYKYEPNEQGYIDKKWNEGDRFSCDNEIIISSRECALCGDGSLPDKEDYEVWLPRQDQLQDMLKEEGDPWFRGFDGDGLMQWYETIKEKDFNKIQSMEQLWLAFVMKEKYSKIWTGKDWEVNGQ